MGISGGPYIVRDSSLVLELDAADKNSYSGSGTIWKDLANSANTGSLVSGPTFSSANGGSIVFNGTTQYATFQNIGTIYTTDNFTVQYWCLPTATTNLPAESTSGIVTLSGNRFVQDPYQGGGTTAGAGVAVGTNGITVIEHGASYFPSLLTYTGTISNTQFTHVVVTYTSKQPRLYLNGTLVRTGLTSVRSAINLTIGQFGGMAYGYFQGNIANTMWYSRVLSTAEILQNYNEQKSRFGL